MKGPLSQVLSDVFRPDLIEFHKLARSNATHNLQQAFNVAEQNLGLTKLLDPEGIISQMVLVDTVLYRFVSCHGPRCRSCHPK